MFSAEYRQHYKRNITLASPVVLSQLGHILVNVFDSIMVGQTGTVPLAAASLGSSVFTLVLVFGIGISFSITPLIASAEGRQNHLRIALLLLNAIVVNVVLGVALFIAGYLFTPYLNYLQQPQAVVDLAIPYLNILLLSMIPLMFFQGFRQFAEGLSLTKQAMYITLAANLINIFLNYLLIYGNWGFPAMGLNGAGWATLISRVLMAAFMAFYVFYAARFAVYRSYLKIRHISRFYILKITRLGLPIAMQMLFEMGAFSFSAIMIGWLGATELAAHQIAINIAAVTYMMASGIASAATIRVGNQLGKKNYRAMQLAGYTNFILVLAFMFLATLAIVLLKNTIPMLYIQDTNVIQVAAGLLVIAALFQLSDGVQVVGLGALRGLEDVKIPSMISLIAYWVIGLPVGYFLCFYLNLGAAGIWTGLLVGLTFAAFLLFYRFRKLSTKMIQ